MKIKRILLLASATLLASCANNGSNATSADTSGLKEAARAEASKSSVRYDLTGDISIKGSYDSQTILSLNAENLDLETNIKNLNGGILKAKTSDYNQADIYVDGSVGKMDFKSYKYDDVEAEETPFASFFTYAGNANGYLKNGNLYADMSNLNLANALWNGQSGKDAFPKVVLENVLNRFSFQGIGFSGFNFSTTDIETYVLKFCEFANSGNAQIATLKLDVDKIYSVYTSVNFATWVTNEMSSVPPSEQDRALVAARNRFNQQIASIVPSFSLELVFSYDSTGLYSADIDLKTTISPNGAKADEDKKFVYDYDIDVSLKSRSNASFPDIDWNSYVKVNY